MKVVFDLRAGPAVILVFLALSLSFSFVTCTCPPTSSASSSLHPIVFVPGDGYSRIQARVSDPSPCNDGNAHSWFTLWLNVNFVGVPSLFKDCLVKYMTLRYNPSTHKTSNQPGVDIRIAGFGNTSTLGYSSPYHANFTEYFEDILVALKDAFGYQRNVNMRGAPFDFRKAPNELHGYMSDLVHLIEQTYKCNHNRRVILIGHSLGCLTTLYMLNRRSPQWKSKYISAFISISGPYGGSVKAMGKYASGYNFDIPTPEIHSSRDAERSFPSSAFLLPAENFWKHDEVIIQAPTGNYTVANYQQFMDDLDFSIGAQMRKDTQNLVKRLVDPGVPVYCLYGTHVPTPESYTYAAGSQNESWYDSQPAETVYGNGDGSVNLRSLLGCSRWQDAKLYPFNGRQHVTILEDPRFISRLQLIIRNLRSYP